MGQKIAQGVYDFRIMREDGYVYVDKTALLGDLVTGGRDAYYFISRPRRFGKSLMLSTLKYIFQGKRELFKGLVIDKLDYDWKTYPIISFDFFPVETASFDVFKEDLRTNVKRALAEAGADWDESVSTHLNFAAAIDQLAAASEYGQVVVLIDEYDAPVGHALLDAKKATAIREQLSYIYAQLKSHASKIRFLMMTGVTRFTQLSVFSALNNLNDLTMDSRYATLLGYTEEELDVNFDEDMREHAQVMGLSYEDYRAELRRWYNGYRFAKNSSVRVYNPVSVAKTIGPKEPHGSLCALLGKCDFQGFFAKLKALYAHLTYGSTEAHVHESSYLRPLYALLASHPALRVIAEDTQAKGRADLVVESQRNVYVFELKVDKTAQEAIAQIKERGYAEPYKALGKPIYLIGLNFKSENHTLSEALAEALN